MGDGRKSEGCFVDCLRGCGGRVEVTVADLKPTEHIVAKLDISDAEKNYVYAQIRTSRKAKKTARKLRYTYQLLGVVQAITAVVVPAIVGLSTRYDGEAAGPILSLVAIGISVLGSVAAAIERFRKFSANAYAEYVVWGRLTRLVEAYVVLAPPFDGAPSHGEAFREFARLCHAAREENWATLLKEWHGVQGTRGDEVDGGEPEGGGE